MATASVTQAMTTASMIRCLACVLDQLNPFTVNASVALVPLVARFGVDKWLSVNMVHYV